jgi:hypothetical protein
MSGVVQSAMILPPASASRVVVTGVDDRDTSAQHLSSRERVGQLPQQQQSVQDGGQEDDDEEEEVADMVLGTPGGFSARWAVNATKQQDKVRLTYV